ncbi:DMT family transporter [Pseudooceanicola marinus]|uniref:DMT family transporter n=1 Tax=Pseudooceanicola marinus TaxID=396013 RepID=UPI001CD738EC|nr:DMT family transporter [Pseudooceanicola marinus]MCA1337228.1 DMT family transporter [Pseudooceanicola marinus]
MTEARNSRPVVAVGWMLITGVLFVSVTALVKTLGPSIPAAEGAFLRFLLGLVLMAPVLPRLFRLRLDQATWGLVALRGLLHSGGVALWFFAMARIPIADVTALNYLNPILITLGAALFLGETLAFRRIAAVLVALLGAIIILRPGLREISTGHLAMLGTASFFAGSYLISKRLTDRIEPVLVVALMSVTVSIGLAPLALPVWVTPSLGQLGLLMGVALAATAGHYCMTRAFQVAPMTVTQPVTFLQLLWAVILGAVAFGEPPDPWVMLGGALIIAAVSFITWREAQLKRRRITPPVEATKL